MTYSVCLFCTKCQFGRKNAKNVLNHITRQKIFITKILRQSVLTLGGRECLPKVGEVSLHDAIA